MSTFERIPSRRAKGIGAISAAGDRVISDPRGRPVPDIRGAGRPYWSAGAQGVLRLPFCEPCADFFWYPRLHCPRCGSGDVSWRDVSGRGVVYSYTIVRQTSEPFFLGRVPYMVAVIQLAEGPRILANVEEVDEANLRIGLDVRVRFEQVREDIFVPVFVPGRPGGSA